VARELVSLDNGFAVAEGAIFAIAISASAGGPD
jgi:hypothetical protein